MLSEQNRRHYLLQLEHAYVSRRALERLADDDFPEQELHQSRGFRSKLRALLAFLQLLEVGRLMGVTPKQPSRLTKQCYDVLSNAKVRSYLEGIGQSFLSPSAETREYGHFENAAFMFPVIVDLDQRLRQSDIAAFLSCVEEEEAALVWMNLGIATLRDRESLIEVMVHDSDDGDIDPAKRMVKGFLQFLAWIEDFLRVKEHLGGWPDVGEIVVGLSREWFVYRRRLVQYASKQGIDALRHYTQSMGSEEPAGDESSLFGAAKMGLNGLEHSLMQVTDPLRSENEEELGDTGLATDPRTAMEGLLVMEAGLSFQPGKADLLRRPIDELELSVRAARTLRAESIHSIGDLVRHSEEELRKLPNMGRQTLAEIKEALRVNDLTLGMKIKERRTSKVITPTSAT